MPELPLRKGIEWLNAVLDNAWFDEAELAARAYALYTLAGAKAIDVAEAPVLPGNLVGGPADADGPCPDRQRPGAAG